ncbi:ankyrin repeat-containing protein DDB_G0279043-like [Vitis riparia]|uniref:ankyrin repeat-containing protein DDB_G0279043-like n=1 Tax=Vitis riparia TaxID=96939 RepID=UPI00155A6882|nr:ankyrin repeat-containing protein DDB_G0279043-like [Vitis riparia]
MVAERGFRDLVNIIIENTTLNLPAHTGPMRRTALHAAVVCHDLKMVKRLLTWKSELTKEVDENGWSPLHYAAYFGYVSIARQLLDKSEEFVVYLPVKNDDNKTTLLIAATHGNRSVMRLLVSYPDCCEQVDVKGNNALHLFMMQKEVIHGLLKIPSLNVRALINGKNVEGQTPLHLFAHSQLKYRLAYLKNKKVDKMALNNQNLTALDIISSAKDLFGRKPRIVRHLKRAKARAGPLLW